MRYQVFGVVLAGAAAWAASAQEGGGLSGGAGAQQGELPPLIDREVLFGNPQRAALRVSPDGRRLAWLAPDEGVLNVWVAPIDDVEKARAVTADRGRGIRSYFWSYGGDILYIQDKDGDENWQVHLVDLQSGEQRNLTPVEEIRGEDGEPIRMPDGSPMRPTAQVFAVSRDRPGEIVVGLNSRDPQLHDPYLVDLETGEMELIERNERFVGYLFDDAYALRYAISMDLVEGGQVVWRREGEDWVEDERIPNEDMLTTQAVGFNAAGDVLYMIDSRGRDLAALVARDLSSGEERVLAEGERADVTGVMRHPRTREPQAASSEFLKTEWRVIDEGIAGHIERLREVDDGELSVTARALDDSVWTVAYVDDDGPARFYVYRPQSGEAEFLFTNRPELEGLPLAPMHPVVIETRDGLEMVSYLTLPSWADGDGDGRPDQPLPMVLFVHGGPWARDSWGYNPYHQWMANRGYAVLSPNFRGSTGFGKAFINAANLEWAGRMHDDLIDAVDWAVEEGIADEGRVAIMGGSYGGYATLVGLTFTPEVFAAGVDIVGPSNLNTLLSTIPPYWKPMMDLFATRVGDPRTEEGRALLEERSPLTRVEAIRRPLLIGQGANDPRVKQSESDQIVEEMQRKGIAVTYVVYPDEGHGFARPENRMSFFAVTDQFLAEHLGGRAQPIGDDFEGSSIEVREGAEHVPGVAEALKN